MATPKPIEEAARLAALHQYHVLDTPRERQFDDLVWLVAAICEVPIALVSLVDQHRLWFKGRYGVEVTETPREDSFCAHAILAAPEMLIVPDTTRDARFTENALVRGAPHIRFYAGAPLVTPEGHAVGTLCVLDRRPRQLTPTQANALQVLSRQVMNQLELRRRLAELSRTSQELKEANAELEGFSHAISHDLRGPLRASTSFSQLLLAHYTHQLDSRGVELLRRIEHNGERLSEILDAFLRLLRLRQQPLALTDIDMGLLVGRVLQDLQMQRGHPQASIRTGPLPEAWGDKGLLGQVWVNLISNALKFSRKRAEPVIEIGGHAEAGRVVYFVKDNGVGFAMKDTEHLWVAFRRLQEQGIEGTGLGLSIVRRILARHGGTAWAEGAPDRGATFYFALPKPTAAPVAHEVRQAA